MVKIQEQKNRSFITIPRTIMKVKGWQKGMDLLFNIDHRTGQVVIQKIQDLKA